MADRPAVRREDSCWVQDVYPEVAAVLTGQSWLRVLSPLRNLAWRKSDGCVTLGTDMAATLARGGVHEGKITVSPNWAPAGLAVQSRGHRGFSSRRVATPGAKLMSSPTRAISAACMISARCWTVAEALRDDAENIVFVFIGGGAQRRDRLQAQAAKRSLTSVRACFPAQPRARHAGVARPRRCSTSLPSCPGANGSSFPSKLYGVDRGQDGR